MLDIDHTVSDATWRDGMIGVEPWDTYHQAAPKDKPIPEMVGLVAVLSREFHVICVTARPEKWRNLTMTWLIKHNVLFHELLMRPDDCYLPAPESKLKVVKQRLGEDFKSEVAFVLDDRDDVAAAFKGEGVTVLQVHARRLAA